MIYHNKYTISLERLSTMIETRNRRLILRYYWLPVRVSRAVYDDFLKEFSKIFNSEEIDFVVETTLDQMALSNKIQIYYPAIFTGLAYTPHPRFRELYKKEFGKEYRNTKDLDLIVKKIEFLSKKLREQRAIEQERDKGKRSEGGISFEKIITNVETVLERPIDRRMKLYQFKFAYDSAVEKGKALEKLRRKNA